MRKFGNAKSSLKTSGPKGFCRAKQLILRSLVKFLLEVVQPPSCQPLQCRCRFTWEVIKRNKHGRAIILTTHSMEEADLLCDKIAIMAEGDLAAVGTSMDLKQRFGVGYRLTVVKQGAGSSEEQVENRYVDFPAALSSLCKDCVTILLPFVTQPCVQK